MRSVLWMATLKKYNRIADLLIRTGADVMKPIGRSRHYDRGVTLLHLAAASGKIRRVKLLLRHGADVNATDSRGKSVLHYAVVCDRAEIVELLLDKGARLNAKDNERMTVLHEAVLKQSENATKVLLSRGADVDAVESRGWNALHLAVLVDSLRLAEAVLRHGIYVDMRDMLMWTPLHFASNSTKQHMVQLLLEYGADVNSKSTDGFFPLYYSVATDNMLITKLLLNKGANVNEKTKDGETVLHVACKRGFVKITKMLLDFKADVNAKNVNGAIALVSITQDNYDAAKVVIKHIAKLTARNEFVNDENWQAIKLDSFLQRFYDECHNEIAKMKHDKVQENCNISYYYIFSKDNEKLASLIRNDELVAAFETSNYSEKYSIYYQDLQMRFAVAKRRKEFIFSLENYLYSILCTHVPNIIVQKIVTYLKFEDFLFIK